MGNFIKYQIYAYIILNTELLLANTFFSRNEVNKCVKFKVNCGLQFSEFYLSDLYIPTRVILDIKHSWNYSGISSTPIT